MSSTAFTFDTEDLSVISALTQDAVFPATELRWDRKARRFALLVNRYRWETGARATQKERVILQGDVPSPANPPEGCNFCTRCPAVMDICKRIDPEYREVKPGRFVACHLHNDTADQTAGSEDHKSINKEKTP